jgi:hypothetical protein
MLKNVNLFYFSSNEEGEEIKRVSLSRDATTTINSIVTCNDDTQVDSVRQVTKFGKDIKTGRWKTKKTN